MTFIVFLLEAVTLNRCIPHGLTFRVNPGVDHLLLFLFLEITVPHLFFVSLIIIIIITIIIFLLTLLSDDALIYYYVFSLVGFQLMWQRAWEYGAADNN